MKNQKLYYSIETKCDECGNVDERHIEFPMERSGLINSLTRIIKNKVELHNMFCTKCAKVANRFVTNYRGI